MKTLSLAAAAVLIAAAASAAHAEPAAAAVTPAAATTPADAPAPAQAPSTATTATAPLPAPAVNTSATPAAGADKVPAAAAAAAPADTQQAETRKVQDDKAAPTTPAAPAKKPAMVRSAKVAAGQGAVWKTSRHGVEFSGAYGGCHYRGYLNGSGYHVDKSC